MVFTGVNGAPASHCGNKGGNPYTTQDTTPTLSEKPWISVDGTGKWSINVPAHKANSKGSEWGGATKIGFEQVSIFTPSDSADAINAKLSAGQHVILTPGIYHLSASLKLSKANQLLLGLGFPTLIPTAGNPVVEVGNVEGVRVVGPFIIQAGTQPTKTLLRWGDGSYQGNPNNPGMLYDIFGRVGGPDGQIAVQADKMIEINNGNVIGDNFWLWRADHTSDGEVKGSANPCINGLHVTATANNVTMYGLATEHELGDLVLWEGDGGQTHFYQSELPYDVTQANYGDKGFAGYRVGANVKSHKGYGIAVYSFFRDFAVTTTSGIVVPPALESSFVHPLSVFLSGLGTITHVINDKGPSTGPPKTDAEYVC